MHTERTLQQMVHSLWHIDIYSWIHVVEDQFFHDSVLFLFNIKLLFYLGIITVPVILKTSSSIFLNKSPDGLYKAFLMVPNMSSPTETYFWFRDRINKVVLRLSLRKSISWLTFSGFSKSPWSSTTISVNFFLSLSYDLL